jgi:hypothetical protein
MTYAKRRAARPATAATTTEPWTLDAPLRYWDGVAVAAGVLWLVSEEFSDRISTTYVAFLAYVKLPVPDGLGDEEIYAVGVTVYTLVITVGMQVVM